MEFNGSSKIASELVNYMKGILEWNEKVNLTAIKNPGEFVIKHFFDSFPAAKLPEFRNAETIIDVGTGGGFPGVPLAALCPEKKFVLADSLAKRLRVIDKVALESGITNITTVHGRAEDLGRNPDYRETFDVCVSRAVASLPVLLEYCLPFVKVGGTFIAYKGPEAEEEIKISSGALKKLGGKIDRIVDASDGTYSHNLIVITKSSSTPKAYPRKAGTPSKTPL
ncbi:MAG TPA: 16S rRNA (guanine(527)-N(7))-methyltransferase RsmG [Candidatus Avanaerovorax faecigallinarum]|nr:16S rRNA (guanine(527)-N(7))-methyltransferase RsmG [Candidatus Avanaerovorax faecigallinarum]